MRNRLVEPGPLLLLASIAATAALGVDLWRNGAETSTQFIIIGVLLGVQSLGGVVHVFRAAEHKPILKAFSAVGLGLTALLFLSSRFDLGLKESIGILVAVTLVIFTLSSLFRQVELDLDRARGVWGKRRVSSSGLSNPLGRAAIDIEAGALFRAREMLFRHYHSDAGARDLYALVNSAHALASTGPWFARRVIEALIKVPPLDDTAEARYRAYVMARAASIACRVDPASDTAAMCAEQDLLRSKDEEVLAYAMWIRASREAALEDVDTEARLRRAGDLAEAAGLTEIAVTARRRANVLRDKGQGYRRLAA